MIGENLRQFAACLAIAAAVIIADWMFVASPAQARRTAAQNRLDNASELLASLDLPAGVERTAAIESLTQRARGIAEKSQLASEPLQIYDAILALANRFSVQIDRMDPTASSGATSENTIHVTGFEIEAVGEFNDILGFMDAIESNTGFARVAAASLEPRVINNERVIVAIIRTRHYAFDLGEAETLLSGKGVAP